MAERTLAYHERKQARLAETLRKADLAAAERRVYVWMLRVSAPREPTGHEHLQLARLVAGAATLIEDGLRDRRYYRDGWRVRITPTSERTETR